MTLEKSSRQIRDYPEFPVKTRHHHAERIKNSRFFMKKVNLTIYPENIRKEFDESTLLLDALSEMGVLLKTPCGGKGFCGKCGIRVKGDLSERSSAEEKFFPGDAGFRLACQTVLSSDTDVFSDSVKRGSARKILIPGTITEAALAVDIGTTTIQVALVDIPGGRSFLLDSFLNPQRRFGHDIIARISASADTEKYTRLVSTLRISIMKTAATALSAAGIRNEAIRYICFSGNTTMLYFLFGLDVQPLGVFPYHAAHLDFERFDAAGIEFSGFPAADIYALPAASSYLGGDLIGGLALTHGMGFRENIFFIDLGTNGEIFLRNGGATIYATSCAMGPALEGMNISSGMTADDGAIAHVDSKGRKVLLDVLGGVTPQGICGTGLVDAVALMLREKILKPDGAFNSDSPAARELFPEGVIVRNRTKTVMFTRDIPFSQKDIRNIQLAKGASLSASNILLREGGCGAGEIKHVFIAGAFGENLNLENFRMLRFIPDFPNAGYHFLGNSSLAAAERACRDPEFLPLARSLRNEVRVIELSAHPEFNDEFVQCLNF